jgi:hypothetical protein
LQPFEIVLKPSRNPSLFGPLLLNLFINDEGNAASGAPVHCHFATPKLNFCFFSKKTD